MGFAKAAKQIAWCGRLTCAVLLASLPSKLKVPLYRFLYGWEIGRDVRIGFTMFVGVGRCRIDDQVRIGHFNVFWQIEEMSIGKCADIGFLNLLRGGRSINIGAYVTILRCNVINSIPKPDVVNNAEPVLEIGPGSVISSGHRLDFTDRIRIGAHTILGGRNSSLWTHNRQRTRPIMIGSHCYVGSEVRVAPGVELPDFCIVSIGSVLMGRFTRPRSLILGNPARCKRPLRESEFFLIVRKTRNDIPDDVATGLLPNDLRDVANSYELMRASKRLEQGEDGGIVPG